MAGRKSWQEKRESGKPAHVDVLAKPMFGLAPGSRLLIATPKLVEAYMRDIPRGEERTIARMRDEMATQRKADATCPLTSAIFARIVAEAALEEMAAGRQAADVAPFWRLFDANSPTAKKLSCGTDFVATQRTLEGIGASTARKKP